MGKLSFYHRKVTLKLNVKGLPISTACRKGRKQTVEVDRNSLRVNNVQLVFKGRYT